MFEQRPPRIKEAIFNFLRGVGQRAEKEITANLSHLSKSATPERSINRTLNELYKKGILEKIYLKDDTFFTWDKLKPEDKKKRYPRFYRLVQEQIRKQVSTSIYCGSNSMGNQDDNPNYDENSTRYHGSDRSPRKTPSDIKAWTFDTIKNKDVDRFEELAIYLFNELMTTRLTSDENDCIVTQYGVYLKDLKFPEFKAMLGYDGEMPMANVEDYKLYPQKFWSIRGVEQ